MSDNWIALIPEDPGHVPDEPRREDGRDRFAEIALMPTRSESKSVIAYLSLVAAEILERVSCPSCSAEIPTEWWSDRMGDDFSDGGFKLIEYSMPCCDMPYTLHQLSYDWPQGFGRFALEAMNPNIGRLDAEYKNDLERILGVELRVIYQHV